MLLGTIRNSVIGIDARDNRWLTGSDIAYMYRAGEICRERRVGIIKRPSARNLRLKCIRVGIFNRTEKLEIARRKEIQVIDSNLENRRSVL